MLSVVLASLGSKEQLSCEEFIGRALFRFSLVQLNMLAFAQRDLLVFT